MERRRAHDVLANQPVGLIDVLFGFPLPEHGTETVGQALTEPASFVGVIEVKACTESRRESSRDR